MLLIVLVFCVAATPCSLGQKVHEQMSAEQVAEIFQTTHDAVPKYEVVQFHVLRLKKRALGELETLKIRLLVDKVKLWLKPAEGVLAGQSTPVFMAHKNRRNGSIDYREVVGAMKNVGLMLEDPVTKATLLARTDASGQYSFNGFIGSENLIVRSLPESISNDLLRNSSSHNSESSGNQKSAYHVVFKREVKNSDTPFDHFQLAEQRTVGRKAKTSSTRRTLPKIVYPEFMVVVDWSLYRMYKYNIEKLLGYVLAFWNGVDLLYRAFDEPKFRFNIPRIIISIDDEAIPYLSDHSFELNSSKLISAYPALHDATRYFYSIGHIFPTNSYDAIVIMTCLKMADKSGKPNILGVAEVGGACGLDHKAKRVRSVALTTDDGTFRGVPTVAHEFGHLLGSRHDQYNNWCKEVDGYIMTPTAIVTEHSHDFSSCAVTAIGEFLKRKRGFCLYNKPIVSDPLPRGYLPGVATNRDRQCELMGYARSCYFSPKWQEPCTVVYCRDKSVKNTVCQKHYYRIPPDGAFCDKGKICVHGKCVKL